MYKLCYTCQAVCWDEITREFEHTGYFETQSLLDYWLTSWSGDRYNYFITPAQRLQNALAKPMRIEDLPLFHLCWHGTQQHHHTFNGGKYGL